MTNKKDSIFYPDEIDKLFIPKDEIARFVRYEITYDQLTEEGGDHFEIETDHPYYLRYEDVLFALRRLQSQGVTLSEFVYHWFGPLSSASSQVINISRATDIWGKNIRDLSDRYRRRGIPQTLSEALVNVFLDLMSLYSEDNPKDYNKIIDLSPYIELLENGLYNLHRPKEEWRVTDDQKREFIQLFFQNDQSIEIDYDSLVMYRKFVEELAEKHDPTAVKAMAYSYYGGNAGFPCNWEKSRDCLIELVKEEQDSFAANALGNIYYYGRCSDGIPDYENAFKYFSIGAANGIYESMYKLADMYAEGCGVPKNYQGAVNLVNFVYKYNREEICKGEDQSKFADAAFRMGNYFRDGIGVQTDLIEAYGFYLEAKMAIDKRIADVSNYGDEKVRAKIYHSLYDLKNILGSRVDKDYFYFSYPFMVDQMLQGGSTVGMTCERVGEDLYKLTFRRMRSEEEKATQKVIVTISAISYCELSDRFTIYCRRLDEQRFRENDWIAMFDSMDYDPVMHNFSFYFEGETVVSFQSDVFFIKNQSRERRGIQSVQRFVSVCFEKNGKNYDYLCDIPEVSVGDRVIVDGGGRDRIVTVTRIFHKAMSEMPLPADHYKKVIRKA